MSWGCKPDNYPNGCGWAQRTRLEGWWCDTCERAGVEPATPEKP